jgi:hypothetical protein
MFGKHFFYNTNVCVISFNCKERIFDFVQGSLNKHYKDHIYLKYIINNNILFNINLLK